MIGNDTYANVARLENARADAKAMAKALAKALEGAGFRVTLVMDADREAMNEALRRFRASIVGGDETVFSYAGHAVELDGVNYLLPTDIRDDNDERVVNDALPLQRVLSGLPHGRGRLQGRSRCYSPMPPTPVIEHCRRSLARLFRHAEANVTPPTT